MDRGDVIPPYPMLCKENAKQQPGNQSGHGVVLLYGKVKST